MKWLPKPERLIGWGHIGLCGVAICWFALLLRGAWNAPGAPMEEGKLLVGARLVSEGRWPNDAFEHLYGPGDVWLVGGLFRLFGESVALERAVGVFATVALVLSVMVIGERVARGAGFLGVTLAASVLLPFGVHAYSWTLGLATLTSGVALLGRPHRDPVERDMSGPGRLRGDVLLAVSGLLCGLSTVFRPDLVVAVVVVFVVVARLSDVADRQWRRWMAWVALGASPWLIHIFLVGPSAVISGVVLDPVFRLRGGRRLPLPFDFSEPRSALERLGLADAWPSPGAALTMGFLLALLAPLVVFTAAALHRSLKNKHRRTFTNAELSLSAAAAVAVAILPQLLQRPDVAHFRFVLPLAAGLLPPAIAFSFRRASRSGRGILCASLVAVVGLVAGSYSIYIDRAVDLAFDPATGADVTHRGHTFPLVDRKTAEEVEALLARIEEVTTPEDRIVVWTESLGRATYSEAYLYHLLPQLAPGTRHLEANPGLATRTNSGFLEDVLGSDIIVLSARFRGWDEPNGSRDLFAPGVRLQQERLCSVGSSGPYSILRPC